MLRREGHVGEDILLGGIHQPRELGDGRPQLVGDLAPLGFGGLGGFLGEGGGDEGGDDPAATPAGMGECIAGEVNAGAVEKALRL